MGEFRQSVSDVVVGLYPLACRHTRYNAQDNDSLRFGIARLDTVAAHVLHVPVVLRVFVSLFPWASP